MLLELNRFLTTEEVRREYRVPPSDAPDLLGSLPVVSVNPDGTRIHVESEVDDCVREYARRKRLEEARSHTPAPVRAGRPVDTLEIALYADELRRQKQTWKQVFRTCKQKWPGDSRVRNPEQIRATHRRHLVTPEKKPD